jgi:rubredoxin/peptidoglycan/LPS O-acetylase OafA/YrhL
MKELVRCRACGYVMEAGKVKDVCPACGISAKVFEPYREKVALNRLFVLNLDLHPITIHLSQTFVILIPLLLLLTRFFPGLHNQTLPQVLLFAIMVFPFTLIAATCTGIIDGLYRFKMLSPPMLMLKIILSSSIIILAIVLFIAQRNDWPFFAKLLLSFGCLFFAFRLGLLGKKLINVIVPGSFPYPKKERKH